MPIVTTINNPNTLPGRHLYLSHNKINEDVVHHPNHNCLEVGQRCKYRIMANKGETGKTVGGFEAAI